MEILKAAEVSLAEAMYKKLLLEKSSEVSKVAQLVKVLVTQARQPELHLSDPYKDGNGQPTPQICPLTLHALCSMQGATVTVIRQVKKKEKRLQGRDLTQVMHGFVNGVKWRRTEQYWLVFIGLW